VLARPMPFVVSSPTKVSVRTIPLLYLVKICPLHGLLEDSLFNVVFHMTKEEVVAPTLKFIDQTIPQ
jgi:hypothetical protein